MNSKFIVLEQENALLKEEVKYLNSVVHGLKLQIADLLEDNEGGDLDGSEDDSDLGSEYSSDEGPRSV